MNIDQIIQVSTPIISGAAGIILALTIFVSRVKSLRAEVKSQMTNNVQITKELADTKQALIDLSQKISYIVEEVKNANLKK
jgi:hypothetical protein